MPRGGGQIEPLVLQRQSGFDAQTPPISPKREGPVLDQFGQKAPMMGAVCAHHAIPFTATGGMGPAEAPSRQGGRGARGRMPKIWN
ncbi:MAG: hypothetical protein CM15mP46_6210 [Alphaproteobacteria bacterium]|nr:MAG: hypothetical protein CM15mP46_6210 [Alphaproteobacteria bacterium]